MFDVSRYDSKKLFVIFLITMVALVIDSAIAGIADIVIQQVITFWGRVLFVHLQLYTD
jgi:hypothetical protein